MHLVIINGPNLNLLGKREPHIYGSQGFDSFFLELKQHYPEVELEYFQSNQEGKLIDLLHDRGFTADGIILNAAAYTHTSVALGDAIRAIRTPVLEVHISNVAAREVFRQQNYLAPYCIGSIVGLGLEGYRLAVAYFLKKSKK